MQTRGSAPKEYAHYSITLVLLRNDEGGLTFFDRSITISLDLIAGEKHGD
ncbi:MAG: hypothetical protein MUF15_12600 [Acidobacteria bacterium]|nr:hypothetical protein [Acidobacteriota bacterium]